jgi:hypothetical protein
MTLNEEVAVEVMGRLLKQWRRRIDVGIKRKGYASVYRLDLMADELEAVLMAVREARK